MTGIEWALLTLSSYSMVWWMVFVGVAVLAAYFGGVGGMTAGHVVLAVLICALDVYWIQSVMAEPGWDGAPDLDLIFTFGMVLRVLLINTFLIPVSLLAMFISRRRRRAFEQTDTSPQT